MLRSCLRNALFQHVCVSAEGALQESLKTHDKDMDARLNKDEFVEFARGLVRNGVLLSRMSLRIAV
jgi:hypothetical protein